MRSIEINGNTLPPTQGDYVPESVYDSNTPSVEATDYILLETTGPLNIEQHEALNEKKVELLQYKGDNVYLCKYKGETLRSVLEDLNTFVVDARVFHPNYVVQSDLKSGNAEEKIEVSIDLHQDIVNDNRMRTVGDQIAAIAGLSPGEVDVRDGAAKVTIAKSKLARLAEIDEIHLIDEFIEPEICNNVAGQILEAHKPVGVDGKIYRGSGQKVCVADTGFDTGDMNKCHEAFQSRVKNLQSFGKAFGRENITNDPDGHGTHVSGSVLGKGNHKNEGIIEAPASEAELMVQSLFSVWKNTNQHDPRKWKAGFGGTPTAYFELFKPAMEANAFIHTNSWVTARYEYGSVASQIDSFVWQNPQMVILFCAGNDGKDGGDDLRTLGLQAQAKNIITVGASDSSKYTGRHPDQLSYLSSKGPTPKGRFKPDVVAPGTSILSTRSSSINPKEHFHEGGWGESSDTKWQYMGGTSMATPLVAGCCAVIRGVLEDKVAKNPSAALVKAILVNGAVPLAGASDLIPNPQSGFGRVDLDHSLQHILPSVQGSAGFGDITGDKALRLQTGVSTPQYSFSIQVPKPSTLKITLVWTDGEGDDLQNHLHLSVYDAAGGQKNGNKSDQSDPSVIDDINNVQQVTWKNAPVGSYEVVVWASRLDFGPQGFAFAWRFV